MRTRVPATVALAAATVALSACGGDAAVRVVEAQGRTALIQHVELYAMDALIVGELTVSGEGCYALGAPDGTVTVAIWPSGWDLDDDGDLRDSGGHVVPLGAEVQVGGGEERFEQGYPDLAERCVGEQLDESTVVLRLNGSPLG